MSKVVAIMSMSLDGYVADLNGGLPWQPDGDWSYLRDQILLRVSWRDSQKAWQRAQSSRGVT
jgi:dihydrofolate reductase